MSKPKMKSAPRERRRQYAALPWRDAPGGVEVMLVTSRGTGRWIIPKGWPMKKKAPHQVAAQEAFEEAGIEGVVQVEALGQYRYGKVLNSGLIQPCSVQVHPLQVVVERDAWPEQAERQRRWFKPEEAAGLVDEPELRALIEAFVYLKAE